MKKIKYIIALLAIIGLSSCGIFKKDCGCPHFGKSKLINKTAPISHYV
jgi:hypothetical protein